MKGYAFDCMTRGHMPSEATLENFMTWVVKNRSIL